MSLIANRPLSRQQYVKYFTRFKKLSERPEARLSGLVSLTIFTVAFFGDFAILPTLKTIAALNRQLKDADLVNSKLQQKIVSLNTVEGEYIRLTPDLPAVEAVLPSTAAFERLAWQINWLVKNLGVEFVSGSFGEFFLTTTDQKEEAVGLTVELSVAGSYSQIKTLIDQIVTLDRLITLNDVSISNKRVTLNNQSLTANLKLTAYYLPETP